MNIQPKSVERMFKYYRNIEDSFWVGKASLRGWRKLASQQIEQAEKIAIDPGATSSNFYYFLILWKRILVSHAWDDGNNVR